MTKTYFSTLLLLLLFTGCAVKKPIDQSSLQIPATTPFSVVLISDCVSDQCLIKPKLRAQNAVEKKLTKTYKKIIEDFLTENSLGDSETALWIFEIASDDLALLTQKSKEILFLYDKNRQVYKYGLKKKEAMENLKKIVAKALKNDEFLYAQAELIRAYEWFD